MASAILFVTRGGGLAEPQRAQRAKPIVPGSGLPWGQYAHAGQYPGGVLLARHLVGVGLLRREQACNGSLF